MLAVLQLLESTRVYEPEIFKIYANQVEELSEDMRRESDLEVRKALGKTSLAFIDLQTMSTATKTGCIILATFIFTVIGVFFYYALFVKEVDPLKVKREKLAARRAAA